MYTIVANTTHTEEEELNDSHRVGFDSGLADSRETNLDKSFATGLDSELPNNNDDLPKIIESSPPPVPPHRGAHVVEMELERRRPAPRRWERLTSCCSNREKEWYSFVQGDESFGARATIVNGRTETSNEQTSIVNGRTETTSNEQPRRLIPAQVKIVMTIGLMCVVLLVCFVWIFADGSPINGGRQKMLLDMSYPFDNTTVVFPTMPRFTLEVVFKGYASPTVWYQANKFCTSEHGGTHIDAPSHFKDGQWTVDEIPINRLIAPAVVINIAEKAAITTDVNVTLDDVLAWERWYGPIPKGAVVFMHSGWGRFWPNATAYLGNDRNSTTDLHFPSFGYDAVRWVIENREVVGFGVDTASLDYGPSTEYPNHKIVSQHNLYGLENVANLGELPRVGARVIIMPMKIKGGSGGPARIVGEFF